MRWFLLGLLSSLLFVSCGDDDLPAVETLSDFRVLGIVSDTPEVVAGDSVNLQLLVSDVDGAGRTISGTYRACTDPGVTLGAEPTCEDASDATAATDISIDFSQFAATAYTGLLGTVVAITTPTTALENATSSQRTNGVGYIVVFRFTVDGEEYRVFKKILISERASKNTNPTAPSILVNDASLASLPVGGDQLKINALTDEETYPLVFTDGSTVTLTESYEIAWYVSEAELDASKVEEEDVVVFDTAPTKTPFVIVAVVRDERGGLSYAINSL